MTWEEYKFPRKYPPEIEKLIGRLTLRLGQLDRLIITGFRQRGTKVPLEELIGIFRARQMTLGNWISWIGEEIKKNSLGLDETWLNELKTHLEKINSQRHGFIHDALLETTKSELFWLSGAAAEKREHRPYSKEEIKESLHLLDELYEFILATENISNPAS